MAWSTNTSTDFPSMSNSTMTLCVPCHQIFVHSYAVVLILSSLVCLPLNVWVARLHCSSPMTEKTDLLSYNLFTSNLLINFANVSTMSAMLVFSRSAQYFWSFLISLTAFGHPLFQCLLCVERYLAVEHPIVFLRFRPLRYRVAVLVPAWMYVLVMWFVWLAHCAIQQGHISQYLTVQFMLFLLIILINSFCCVSILRALVRPPPGDGRRERGKDSRGRQNTKESLNYQIKKKAFIKVSMIQVFAITCYLPPVALIFFLHILEQPYLCIIYMYSITYILFSSAPYCLSYLYNRGKLKWIISMRRYFVG